MESSSRRLFLQLTSVSVAAACTRTPEPTPTTPPAPKVDEHQARRLAVKHYERLTKGMHYRSHVTNELFPFPPMDVGDFQYADALENCWLVRAEPMAGWTVIVRVDKAGDWVEIVSWGLVDA